MIKARVFTKVNSQNRMLIQVINTVEKTVFNRYCTENVVSELIDIQNLGLVTIVEDEGQLIESAKLDSWTYAHGFIPTDNLNEVIKLYVLAGECQGHYQSIGQLYTSISDAQKVLDKLYIESKKAAQCGDWLPVDEVICHFNGLYEEATPIHW